MAAQTIPRPEVSDSDFGAFNAAMDSAWPLPKPAPRIHDMRTIHWLGMPWIVTYKGPYIDEVSINGHWLNAAYVLGPELTRDLEIVALREVQQ